MKQMYDLAVSSRVVTNFDNGWWVLEDKELPMDKSELAAHVQSGDYFELLATKLDTVSQGLGTHQEAEVIALQHIIDDLLYLQKRYQITKR